MKICKVTLLLLFVLATSANAGVWWGNYTGNNDYMDGGNWWNDRLGATGLPEANGTSLWDIASINEGVGGGVGAPTMSAGDITVWNNQVGDYQSGSMSMTGGTLNTLNAFCVGWGTDGTENETTTFNMSGSSVINTPYFIMGAGSGGYDNISTMTMDGGYVWNSLGFDMSSVALGSNSDSSLHINTGWVDAFDWVAMDAGDLVEVGAGGTLQLWGYWQQDATFDAQVTALIAAGNIAAAPGLSLQVTTFDNGQTDSWYGNTGIQITAVPEPITMGLLGLGFGFIRRRK